MQAFDFGIEMQVRDYECDLQGIVNNAVYQNYLEHCRHEFLHFVGFDFAQLHNDGIDAVVIRAEIDYKSPLRPGDIFSVKLKIERKGSLRMVFNQQIILISADKLMLNARITTVLTKNGRPFSPDILLEKFERAGIKVKEA